MGAIHLQPLSTLAEKLQKACNLGEFIETGTFLGYALPWAAATFGKVTTIEVRADYRDQAMRNNAGLENVTYLLGDSATLIETVCRQLAGPALFWLDAHAGAGHFGDKDDCPLLRELEAIVASPHDHCLLIDDARAFLAPPPPPFDYRYWPSLDRIFAILLKERDLHVSVLNDTLIAVPRGCETLIASYSARVRPKI